MGKFSQEKKSESLSKNHRTLMTPNQRLARSIEHQPKEYALKTSLGKRIKASKHEGYSINVDRGGNDLIGRKYRETYGASLISREKSADKDKMRRRSLKKGSDNDISDRIDFNKTI